MLGLDELRVQFTKLFGVENPHDFQLEVAAHLLNGKSVILQAPTGSGKTWTALYPFLLAWQAAIHFPRKCLYAVPLRVLATQFKEEAERITQGWEQRPEIRLQTGEHQDDPTFESDLIFTTIDQVLSSALSVPYSLSRRRANINAGAVYSSFLVCDELHLFPVDETTARGALVTLIELLQTVGDAIPFLLMTATLSDTMLTTLASQLKAERVIVEPDKLLDIPSQRKTRRYHIVDEPLNARAILAQHNTRSIAICNQVQRAVELFESVAREVENDPAHANRTKVTLLHSRFIQDHRQEKETLVRQQFGKTGAGERPEDSQIIIGTQAIEVGLDITCERLHTDLAPANAIIQRAGRCARYANEEGDVLIYGLPDNDAQPYDAKRCAATWEAFSNQNYNGKALTFAEEQQIVTQVHNPIDKQLLDKIERESYTRWQDMSAVMFSGKTENCTRLIRKVDSRTLLVHANPDQIGNPYAWRGFSLFHGTLRGWINRLRQAEELTVEWCLRFPVELPDLSEESRQSPKYQWDNVSIPEQVDSSPLFVVHPDLVAYDRQRGFRLVPAEVPINIAELCQEPPPAAAKSPFLTHYNLETYEQHIERMLRYYQTSGLQQQILLAGQRLERADGYECTAEQLDEAVRVALALHDVGKLQVEWQSWSHTYQEAIGVPVARSSMIVHTDYQPHHPQYSAQHLAAEKAVSKRFRRPHHAAEGACASWPVIMRVLDDNIWLSQAVFTAITRHHAPFTDSAEQYVLHEHSQSAITQALDVAGLNGKLARYTKMKEGKQRNNRLLTDEGLIQGDDPAPWLVYTLIVRALRLCDGHALEGET